MAVGSSDGLLRLDLDVEHAVMPNGTNNAKPHGTESTETDGHPAAAAEEEKKVIKPPMPPSKEAKTSVVLENEPNKQDEEQKVCISVPYRTTIYQNIFP